jgi:hypothetical protein
MSAAADWGASYNDCSSDGVSSPSSVSSKASAPAPQRAISDAGNSLGDRRSNRLNNLTGRRQRKLGSRRANSGNLTVVEPLEVLRKNSALDRATSVAALTTPVVSDHAEGRLAFRNAAHHSPVRGTKPKRPASRGPHFILSAKLAAGPWPLVWPRDSLSGQHNR